MSTKEAQELAEYYSNAILIERGYRASVYLEDESDKVFWDKILQEFRPGNYNYVSYSRNGKTFGGCTQCLKFRGFLSDKFFVCIDSDIRFQAKDKKVSAKEYILQTYTYSWENHFCYANKLQKTIEQKCPKVAGMFNFPAFLSKLSEKIYDRFLYFLVLNKRNFIKEHNVTKFIQLLPQTYSPKDFNEQGNKYLDKILYDLDPYVDAIEENYYKQIGIDRQNTYLHIRGHYIYNLIKFIGNTLCHKEDLNFETDILLNNLQTSGYWQMDNIKRDVVSIQKWRIDSYN